MICAHKMICSSQKPPTSKKQLYNSLLRRIVRDNDMLRDTYVVVGSSIFA